MNRTWADLEKTQPKVVKMLKRSLEKNRLAHAYLLEGSKGTGKLAVALQLAKSFFCQNRQATAAEPCLTCVDCTRIEHGNHPDIHMIEPDGLSIKKQQVEHLQKEFTYRGMESKKKVYLVQDADKMTSSAANSLLKFLEEPEAPTLALLLTEKGQAILPTIQSRSQQLTFSPLPRDEFVARLREQELSEGISNILGSLTTSFDEAIELTNGDWIAQARTVVIQLMQELYDRPNQAFFTVQEKWVPLFKEKKEQELGLDMILLWLRDLLYTQVGKEVETFVDQTNLLQQQALSSSQEKLSKSMAAVIEAKQYLHANVNSQLLMEKLLLDIQEG
ncbi:DNA polymerase III subunit delta' [Alkalihalobacillus sp. 1P02AB]|uniref:DNA polymerase III subunit delta' n=1 Tax=Alkalihalobacillus sp. 1P02AB TaxID=3132260 RepID=UPI0039A5A7EE